MAEYVYRVKKSIDMTEDEFSKCSHLFSMNYGKYSAESPRKPGGPVTMSDSFFEKRYKKEGIYIATCHCAKNGLLVGQAIYVREKYTVGTMTWVMQLVVSTNHRNKGIGSRLLHSIWGFSDDFAWGLATTNPCTVKALERATFRKCDPKVISANSAYIKKLAEEIGFVTDNRYCISDKESQAYTDFYVDNSEFTKGLNKKEWRLGELRPGHEWLAFTFKSQAPDKVLYDMHYNEMIAFSEEKLKEAYGRMRMSSQGWAKLTNPEIDEIVLVCRKE